METTLKLNKQLGRHSRLKSFLFGSAISYVLLSVGCASAKKSEQTHASNDRTDQITSGPGGVPPVVSVPTGENYGPPAPETPGSYGPEPVQVRPLVLVLGPGLSRGYAYVGVLRALKDAKIPIGAIYGTEMGALIGGLYSMSSSMNQFEWGLLKFKDDVFQNKRKFFALRHGAASDGEKLQDKLKQVFGDKDLSQAKVPTKIAIQAQGTHAVLVLDQGNMAKVLRAALSTPSLFTPVNWEDGTAVISASNTRPFLVNEAKNLGTGPVIVINVLKDAEIEMALDELKSADLIIKPEVSQIEELDFTKMTDAAFLGKSAIIKNLPEIRKLVGLPEAGAEK